MGDVERMRLNPKYFIESNTKEYLTQVCLGDDPAVKVIIRLSAESVSSVGDYRFEAKVRIAKDKYWTFLSTAEEVEDSLETFIVELKELVKLMGPEPEQITVTIRKYVPVEGRRRFHDAIINEYAFFADEALMRKHFANFISGAALSIYEQGDSYLLPLSFKFYQLKNEEMKLLNGIPFEPYAGTPQKSVKQDVIKFKGWYAGHDLSSINLLLCYSR